MTDNDVRQLLNILTPFIDKRIAEKTTNLGVTYRLPAIVVGEENEIHYATVIFPALPNRDDQKMRLMNCSGVNLRIGDNVWVDYSYSLDNAYISIKNDGRPWGWKAGVSSISVSGSTGSTGDHSILTNRDKSDQHPMGSITDLVTTLANKEQTMEEVSNTELLEIWNSH